LTNLKLIPQWIDSRYAIHDRKALLISAGHSFTQRPEESITEALEGEKKVIFAVKHALPYFEVTPYRPDFCIALDPREIDGTSTLGHVRKKLYKIYPETTYLIASMTHPSVTEYLLANGANVVGWHSACSASTDPEVQALVPTWITGGSCSAMRAPSLARVFGFRDVSLLGYDSAFTTAEAVRHLIKDVSPELKEAFGILDEFNIPVDFGKIIETVQTGPAIEEMSMANYLTTKGFQVQSPPPQGPSLLPVITGDYKNWISPEIAAQVKDIEALFRSNTDIWYRNFSGGFCKSLFDSYGGEAGINPRLFPMAALETETPEDE